MIRPVLFIIAISTAVMTSFGLTALFGRQHFDKFGHYGNHCGRNGDRHQRNESDSAKGIRYQQDADTREQR